MKLNTITIELSGKSFMVSLAQVGLINMKRLGLKSIILKKNFYKVVIELKINGTSIYG